MARRDRDDSDTSQPDEVPSFARPGEEPPIKLAAQQAGEPEGGSQWNFQAIIELAPDALVIINNSGRILLVNHQTELLFGYDRASLLGSPVETLIPERFHSAHVQHRASYLAAPRARAMGSDLQLFGRRKDGSEFPAEVSIGPLDPGNSDGMPLIIATVRDISELRRTEAAHAALESANRELRQLLALTDTALSSLALDDLLGELLERARTVMGVDDAAVLLLDESVQELYMRAERGPGEALPRQARFPMGQGVAGRIAATRAPLIVDDLLTFPVANPILRDKLRSVIGTPLLAGERLLGVLLAGSATLRRFSDQDVRLMELLGERIALAIDRARLHEAALTAQAEAERERARWRAVVNNAPAFVITCDADLRLTYFNPAFERLLGSRADLSVPYEERPARFGVLLPDGSGPIAPDQAPLARTVREGRVIHGIELLYRHPETGDERLVVWDTAPMRADDGSLLGAVSVGWDVTEQRRLERAERARTTLLEAVFESVADGIVVTDSNGRTLLSNAAYRAQLARIHAGAPSDLLRERVAQSPPLDEQGQPLPREQWPHVRALRGEVVSGAHAVRMVRRTANGEDLIFNVTAAPLRDAEGVISGVVSVIHDVTARKQLEREREEARARELAALEVSQRLDEFFAIAAHDIRNPVTTIYISIQTLQRRLNRLRAMIPDLASGTGVEAAAMVADMVESYGSSLRSARSDIERLIRLINLLFDIAQARAGKLELRLVPCDLAAITREQIAAQRAAQPERTIQLELPGDQRVMVLADADRLGEVLANYLTNALKYSPAEHPVAVRLEVAGGRAKVAVRDEGPGLPPEEQPLVWEMFHRAPGVEIFSAVERQGSGLGVGLHICKWFVEAHPGGEVGVESEPGAGSTFWFALPLLGDAPSPDVNDAR